MTLLKRYWWAFVAAAATVFALLFRNSARERAEKVAKNARKKGEEAEKKLLKEVSERIARESREINERISNSDDPLGDYHRRTLSDKPPHTGD